MAGPSDPLPDTDPRASLVRNLLSAAQAWLRASPKDEGAQIVTDAIGKLESALDIYTACNAIEIGQGDDCPAPRNIDTSRLFADGTKRDK